MNSVSGGNNASLQGEALQTRRPTQRHHQESVRGLCHSTLILELQLHL